MPVRTEVEGSIITCEIRNKWKWVYVPRMDPTYFLPTRDFVLNQIVKSSMHDLLWRPNTCDCDNLAVILWGKVEERECMEKWKYPMPFGVSLGKLADGRMHMCNCFYSDNGFEFYDVLSTNLEGFKPSMILM